MAENNLKWPNSFAAFRQFDRTNNLKKNRVIQMNYDWTVTFEPHFNSPRQSLIRLCDKLRFPLEPTNQTFNFLFSAFLLKRTCPSWTIYYHVIVNFVIRIGSNPFFSQLAVKETGRQSAPKCYPASSTMTSSNSCRERWNAFCRHVERRHHNSKIKFRNFVAFIWTCASRVGSVSVWIRTRKFLLFTTIIWGLW